MNISKFSKVSCVGLLLVAAACVSQQQNVPVVEKTAAPERAMVATPPVSAVVNPSSVSAGEPARTNVAAAPSRERAGSSDAIARIKEEGMNRSQVMETLSYMTDVIGPRLTGSPQMKRANEWTKTKMESWGLSNAKVEPWGTFGRGWSLQKFSADIVSPQYFPLKAHPNAWSASLGKKVEAEVVLFDAANTNQLEKFRGKLKGAVVLGAPVATVPTRFEPLMRRYEATNLLAMANAAPPATGGGQRGFGGRRGGGGDASSTNQPTARRGGGGGGGGGGPAWQRYLPFLAKEGVAAILKPSSRGDAGTIFVQSASVPQAEGEGTNPPPARVPAFATSAPRILPQITVAVEDYNRLVRMVKLGEKLRISMELEAQYHSDDLVAYNTVAEIPGTDLKDEIVMVGGHLDSWHAGTGATDNATGCAAAMEALRIIKTLDLKPRRTIRVALWSGEEQGLFGSRGYVSNHFGYFTTNRTEGSRGRRELVKKPDYEKFSAYFNMDNGAGKFRGIYMQGNEAVRPIFRRWLEPLRELGAETLTPANTGSTDHVSFHNIGLPGFQFIQDPMDYSTRTHHSNEDVYDRVQPEDLKQAATVMAVFAYNAAMMDEKLPRLPVE